MLGESLGPILLPPHARGELAWQDVIIAGPLPLGEDSFSRTVPGETFEVVQSVRVDLITDATVANRHVLLEVVGGGGGSILFRVPAPATQPASRSANYSFLANLSAAYGPVSDTSVAPLLPMLLPSGYRISIQVGNMQAGDQLEAIVLTLLRIPSGPARPESRLRRLLQPVSLGGDTG